MEIRLIIDGSALWRNVKRVLGAGALLAAALAMPVALGGQASVPHAFSSGGVVRASDFNANFAALRDEINDNDARIGDLTTLATTAQADLVSALNEVAQRSPVIFIGAVGELTAGVGVNAWTAGALLADGECGTFYPAALVAGKPFTATVRVQTADTGSSPLAPGLPLVGGDLVFDLEWFFTNDGDFSASVSVLQPAVATMVIDTATNDYTITFTGAVPAAPTTPGGLATTNLDWESGAFFVRVNGATTAQGQGVTSVDLRIQP